MSKEMEKIVALCKRRGFVFQSSEIYGGINGFWDFGPLGVELKRNLKEVWWKETVQAPGKGPNGGFVDMVGLDSSIVMNPKVWEASGHIGGFSDPMVDCKESKARYRADHLVAKAFGEEGVVFGFIVVLEGDDKEKTAEKKLGKVLKKLGKKGAFTSDWVSFFDIPKEALPFSYAPESETAGTLTEPRQFNLMFKTMVGALEDPSSIAYLRPETAQGIFANFRNVMDTSRVKIPFGIAQIGKAFRNEVTPRNFIFRSREFEQMEIEFFVHPNNAKEWYEYWKETRFQFWRSLGISAENLRLRPQDQDELAHYAKEGVGSSDIEYRFPFTNPGFGELEGIAHRTDYDLRQHALHSKEGDRMKYFDPYTQEKYFPHVIEPSAGVDRGALALLCEGYTEDENRPSGVYLKFHPKVAPIKAAIFPLIDKEEMGEIASNLYAELRQKWNVQLDVKQNIGKRYARMDEAGTPFCFTIDNDTIETRTVTVRDRDTLQQKRIPLAEVAPFIEQSMQ